VAAPQDVAANKPLAAGELLLNPFCNYLALNDLGIQRPTTLSSDHAPVCRSFEARLTVHEDGFAIGTGRFVVLRPGTSDSALDPHPEHKRLKAACGADYFLAVVFPRIDSVILRIREKCTK
jgi:hypothetical protein